jgi:diguanylate cyclase (GGDEF)-like protein/PAS domain S-box-containing protein
MSIAAHALTAAGIATSGAATVVLWATARGESGGTRRAYLWFAGTAALWCVGLIAQALGVPLGGVSSGPTLADLPSLLALATAVAGVAELVAESGRPARERWRALGQRVTVRGLSPRLADSLVFAACLFVVGWLTLFGPEYISSGAGAGTFSAELVHPLAGLVAIALLLPLVADAGRPAFPPFAAVILMTASDALGVSARLNGVAPGAAEQAVRLTAFCVLGLTPWLAGRGTAVRERAARLPGTAIVAAATAGLTALLVCVWSLVAGHVSPALVVVAGVAVIALAGRLFGLFATSHRRESLAHAGAGPRFRELAELTSDAVLLCHPEGEIRYASPAVCEFGYLPADLHGRRLDELVHPEDRPASRRAVAQAFARRDSRQAQTADRFPCRVRAADGTWRHVQATVARYPAVAGADMLLVTARDVSDQVALRRQVTHLTFHDGLTGLPNRAYMEERAMAALRGGDAGRRPRGDQVASPAVEAGVIFLDLDGFSAVNDSVGHRAGDLLIAQAGRRLRAAVPPHETVVRWGGDEFAVLAEDAAGAQEIVELAERLERSVAAEPFRVAERDIALTASVGVAFAGSDPPGSVLRNADVAMVRAKDSGGGRVEVFAAHMHKDLVRRLELTSDLQQAISGGQLMVDYQPVVELATSRVSGAEALIRWWRGGAAVPPGEFLGIAEESGLIVPLGTWVLRLACGQAVRWRRSAGDMTVSVNFSPRQVAAEHCAESVLGVLEETGLPPEALTVEVTERALVAAAGPAVRNLSELRRAGVRLAIDDFGTGYASLVYLRQLPVDIIKIDPSFVAGLGEDDTLTLLTRTIIRLGHDLGLSVVAEGIESSAQLGLLRDMGCGLGQGYLVAPPMSAAEVESLIRTTTLPDGGSRPGTADTNAADPDPTGAGLAGSVLTGPVLSGTDAAGTELAGAEPG